ncbi:MAG: dihydroorotate dehydrogenase [Deltaproteobacteria bacterium]|nr:dihydroorotate dehydrogenase [Deltaproteobacteria bacterium]
MKPRMEVSIGKLKLQNPVMTASGTFGYGEEYAPYVDLNRLGAIIVKGISLEPRPGNPPPRIMETEGGMLNAIGLENVGVSVFIRDKIPSLRNYHVPIIVNIFGESLDEYKRVAEILGRTVGVHALEVNISCPNVEKGGLVFGCDPDMCYEVTRAIKAVTDLPVIVKLTPNVTDIAALAMCCEAGGADAVSLINTLKGMSVDIEKRVPHLSRVTGGLSGPAVKPVALRMVWEVVKEVSIPVIGIGGIMTAEDALAFLIVGARAVQVGTANFINPRATMDILKGIEAYLIRHGMGDVNELIGSLKE